MDNVKAADLRNRSTLLALERMLGADHQLVIMPDGGVNLTPHRLTPLGILVKL